MKIAALFFLESALLFFSVWASCAFGSSRVSLATVFRVLTQQIIGISQDGLTPSDVYIVWSLRFPRAILAFAVGGGLAIAGASMQSITRNVMADPYILGVSSGALAFVSVGFLVGGALTLTRWFIPLLAFLGAVVSLLVVMAIGGFSKYASPAKLVLSGMAVSFTLSAVAQFCIYQAQGVNTGSSIVAWMMGSLAGARWNNIWIPFFGSLAGAVFFLLRARAFDLIALGDETAISLGTDTVKTKRASLVVVALLAGLSVASCGIIGLVGFVVPHIVRFLLGTEHRRMFPMVFIVGGIFLIWMDIISRVVLSPQEVPVGIFTALCGGPYFIWIMRRERARR